MGDGGPDRKGTGEGTIRSSFSISLPTARDVATRSTGTVPENMISTLHLLLCDPAANGRLVATIDCVPELELLAPDASRWGFVVEVPQGTWDMLLVANASEKVSALTVGTSRRVNVETIGIFNTTRWVIDGTSEATSIPMYGSLSGVTVSSTGVSNDTFQLTRMLARINVEVAAAARDDFALTQVYFNRPVTGGRLASVSGGISLNPTQSYVSRFNWGVSDPTALLNQIYVFESRPSTDPANPVCIIVQGNYNGASSYYRLDPVDASGAPIDIVRNHSYNFVITSVNGAGAGSISAAIAAGASNNIDVEVIDYDDADTGAANLQGTKYPVTVKPAVNGSAMSNYALAPQGLKVTVSATPAQNYSFAGWSASGMTLTPAQQAANPMQFTMPARGVILTPSFASDIPGTVTILPTLLEDVGAGYDIGVTFTATPYTDIPKGATVTLSSTLATTNLNYVWVGWEVLSGNITAPANSAGSFLMPDGAVVLRPKVRYRYYRLNTPAVTGGVYTATANYGLPAPPTGVRYNERIALEATPRDGYLFNGWVTTPTSVAGVTNTPANSVKNPTSFNMPSQEVTVSPSFIQGYRVTATVSPATMPAVTYSHAAAPDPGVPVGTAVTLTVPTAPDYTFTGWTGDITSTDNPLTVTVTDRHISVVANSVFSPGIADDLNQIYWDPENSNGDTPVTIADAINSGYCDRPTASNGKKWRYPRATEFQTLINNTTVKFYEDHLEVYSWDHLSPRYINFPIQSRGDSYGLYYTIQFSNYFLGTARQLVGSIPRTIYTYAQLQMDKYSYIEYRIGWELGTGGVSGTEQGSTSTKVYVRCVLDY